MLADERRQSVLEVIQENGAARTTELATRFGVSSQTIRRDLMTLEAHGHISKGYGGGMLAYQGATYRERAFQNQQEKTLIAHRAVSLVEDGVTVGLGPGTTTEAIAHLLNGRDVHVVTNSLPVARAITHPATAISLCGGRYRPDSDLVTGAWTALTLGGLFAEIGFIGVSGIGQEAGYTVTEADEAAVLRHFIRVSKRAVVVVDSSKFHRVAAESVAPLAAVHLLITDDHVSEEHLGWLHEASVEVEVVGGHEPGGRETSASALAPATPPTPETRAGRRKRPPRRGGGPDP